MYTDSPFPGGYIIAAYNLPNREFYSLFKGIDEQEIYAKIKNVMLYAALEFASFIMLAVALRHKIQTPMFHQLAFAVESQWGRVQAKILVWVLFTIQLPLEHFGKPRAAGDAPGPDPGMTDAFALVFGWAA